MGIDVISADSSLCLQASNGGHTSDYSSSLPSSPNVGHRELRAEAAAVAGLSTPGSLHRAAKRRTSLFAVLIMLSLFFFLPVANPLFLLSHCLPVILSPQTSLLGSSSSLSYILPILWLIPVVIPEPSGQRFREAELRQSGRDNRKWASHPY